MQDYQEDNNIITLKQILRIVFKYKWFICIVVLLFGMAAIFYIKSRLPVYTSKALISASSVSQANSLKRDKNLKEVVNKLQLDIKTQPNYFPIFGEKIALIYNLSNYKNQLNQPLYGLSSYAWGGEKLSIASLEVGKAWKGKSFELVYLGKNKYQILDNAKIIINGQLGKTESYQLNKYAFINIQVEEIHARKETSFSIKQKSASDAVEQLKSKLSVKPVSKGSNNYYVQMSGHKPKEITNIVNEVVENFSSAEIDKTLAAVSSLRNYLYSLLPGLQKRITKNEKQYIKDSSSYYKHLNKDGQVLINQNLKEVIREVSQLKVNKLILQKQMKLYPERTDQYKSELIKIEQQLQDLNAQINDLKQSLEKLMGEHYANEAVHLRLMAVQMKYQAVINQISIYNDMASISKLPVKLISKAKTPLKGSVKPASLLVLIGALLAGLIVSLSIVFLWVYLRGRIVDIKKIEQLSDLNMLVEVPKLKSVSLFSSNKKVFSKKAISSVSNLEKMRILKSNLLSYKKKDSCLIISFTSASLRVDSAYIAANLSLLLSQSTSSRILIINANTRTHSELNSYFNVSSQPGLTHLFKDPSNKENIIQHSQYENIDYISSGDVLEGNTDVINEEVLGTFIEDVSKRYDFIIINNAPILIYSDAIEYMHHSHVNLLVLNSDAHTEKDIKEIMNTSKVANVEYKGFIVR